jgi:NTP pyrophosphatase (non-canonical NTP hydrolase)
MLTSGENFMPTKYTIEFAPGCFDDFEGTQEELEELILQLMNLADNGELFNEAMPVSEDEAVRILEKIKDRRTN